MVLQDFFWMSPGLYNYWQGYGSPMVAGLDSLHSNAFMAVGRGKGSQFGLHA
jgi:hypothetical protein